MKCGNSSYQGKKLFGQPVSISNHSSPDISDWKHTIKAEETTLISDSKLINSNNYTGNALRNITNIEQRIGDKI
jgi:hypothetical protein